MMPSVLPSIFLTSSNILETSWAVSTPSYSSTAETISTALTQQSIESSMTPTQTAHSAYQRTSQISKSITTSFTIIQTLPSTKISKQQSSSALIELSGSTIIEAVHSTTLKNQSHATMIIEPNYSTISPTKSTMRFTRTPLLQNSSAEEPIGQNTISVVEAIVSSLSSANIVRSSIRIEASPAFSSSYLGNLQTKSISTNNNDTFACRNSISFWLRLTTAHLNEVYIGINIKIHTFHNYPWRF